MRINSVPLALMPHIPLVCKKMYFLSLNAYKFRTACRDAAYSVEPSPSPLSAVQVVKNEKEWRTWFDKQRPESERIPSGYSEGLDPFKKLLLIRSWCPDRTLSQAKSYFAGQRAPQWLRSLVLYRECR